MKTPSLIVASLAGVFVTGCCVVEEVTHTPPMTRRVNSIELAGLNLDESNTALRQKFENYNNKETGAIFRVREYQNGKQVNEWGSMDNDEVGCQLLAGVDFWLGHGMMPDKNGVPPPPGNSTFAGRVGMTCSTSCICHLQKVSDAMTDEVGAIIAKYNSRHRKHK